MAIVMHPLTAVGGAPAYTASDYRHVVNPLVVPSNGMAFDGLQGVRAGFQSPLVMLDGLTATVNAHCGTVCPFAGEGVYTYAITVPETVKIVDSTSSYKIAVVVDDPTQSGSDIPGGRIQVFPSTTPDSNIPGLVLALVESGVVSIVVPVLYPSMLVEVFNEKALEALSAVDGQEALVSSTNKRYVRKDGKWVDTVSVSSVDWLDGLLQIMYGADSCTVQVSGVKLDTGSWASATFANAVKEEYRPDIELSSSLCVENGGSSTGLLVVTSDGAVSVKNMGGTGSNGARRGSVSWPVSRRY